MTEDHNYDALEQEYTAVNRKSGVTDEVLLSALRDLRRSEAKRLGIPPFALFQDASLEDMALRYPITLEEMKTIFGVGEGKARNTGRSSPTSSPNTSSRTTSSARTTWWSARW